MSSRVVGCERSKHVGTGSDIQIGTISKLEAKAKEIRTRQVETIASESANVHLPNDNVDICDVSNVRPKSVLIAPSSKFEVNGAVDAALPVKSTFVSVRPDGDVRVLREAPCARSARRWRLMRTRYP